LSFKDQGTKMSRPDSPDEADGLGRRDFLKLAGLGAGVAAVSCEGPPRTLSPYVVPPRNAIVGESSYYASVCRECPAGCGLHVRVREGRAIKLEGNPAHPVNQGTLCGRGQAGILRTYGPRRVRRPQARDGRDALRPVTWAQALRRVGEALGAARDAGDGKVLVWSGLETGTLRQLTGDFARAFGGRHVMFDPHGVEALVEGYRAAFGRADLPRFDLGEADLVLALEADVFETYPWTLEIARQVVGGDREQRAQLVWVGPRRGVTGMLADHWAPTRPGAAGLVALALLGELGAGQGAAARAIAALPRLRALLDGVGREALARRAGLAEADLGALAGLLREARAPVAIPPGALGSGSLGAAGAAAVALLNHVLGAFEARLAFGASSALVDLSPAAELREALARAASGEVDVLVVIDQNPLFDLPGGLEVEQALARPGLTVALGDRVTATTERADVVLPTSTPLESWGDYSPRAGVVGLLQPVMEPVFDSRMTGDVLLGLARAARATQAVAPSARTFEELVRERWAAEWGHAGREAAQRFEEAQRRGGEFAEHAAEAVTVRDEVFDLIERGLRDGAGDDDAIVLAPYAPIGAGLAEQAAAPWLDELPEPTNAVVWGAPAEVHPDLATRLGVRQGDTIEIATDDGRVRLPVVVRDTVRADVVAVPVGGRTEDPAAQWPEAPGAMQLGARGDYRASSAALLLGADALRDGAGVVRAGLPVRVERSNDAVPIFVESRNFEQHHRNLARARGIDTHSPLHDLPVRETAASRRLVDLHHIREYPDHRWAMVVDLDRCTGCSACIVGCYAENNISVVGPAHVDYGREMHWLQLHTYWERDHADRPIPLYTPMMCQHCTQAPCESVCPVYAPYHTPEGLNGQVYNRCVGTRFCSNNCPYKVRRFNWYDWPRPEPMELQLNPDVTARTAGVMEKCTFCVQRIREAKEEARISGRTLADGDVLPACVQTCPTGALVFGDWLDPNSRVRRLVEAEEERAYHVLGHLGTRPAVTYLERVVRWRRS
jgi:molybdopterin-containing oxidoreductase family iron-sulfur binding subunit